MELSAVGESVFAAESIIKRRIRRVLASVGFFPPTGFAFAPHYATISLGDGGGQSCK